ncbi:MAG: winged helix-turn-helix transcriptional regulator [Candidatus Sericytochromatia bacterium]|nr:winged helix-turn-helix transcriptional regulator [Candidatus Sericytochromatia bacterium]
MIHATTMLTNTETWTLEKLTRPHTSKPFNPDIANTFFRAGKIESWGHGIEKMLRACEADGLPKPAYEDEGIGLTLKFLTHLPPQLNETPASAKSSGKSSGKIVVLMQEQATISIPEIAAKLGLTTRAIEKQIRQLKADGVIHRVGPAKGGHWKVIQS